MRILPIHLALDRVVDFRIDLGQRPGHPLLFGHYL
jgi:hypothetical protein